MVKQKGKEIYYTSVLPDFVKASVREVVVTQKTADFGVKMEKAIAAVIVVAIVAEDRN